MELILLLIVIIVLYVWNKNCRKNKLSIYLTDQYMRIDKPIPICGTPDVIWIDGTGVLIVGDYKSRANGQVYDSDIIQLSVYRLLVEETRQRSVAKYGYVHFSNGRRVRVKLLSAKDVIKLYWRYQNIVKGSSKGKSVDRWGYCQFCRHLGKC